MGPPSLGSLWEVTTLHQDVPLTTMRTDASRPWNRRPVARLALLAAPALLVAGLAGCSSDATPEPTTSPTTSTAPSPTETTESPSPTGTAPTRIVAVLCDEATQESQDAIRAAMLPEFTVSQLVDVRADDDAEHAILGFVEGPGLAVLAQWVGDTLDLVDLASADEFAAQVSTAPLETNFDQATQDLLDNTVKCYTTIFGPDEDE